MNNPEIDGTYEGYGAILAMALDAEEMDRNSQGILEHDSDIQEMGAYLKFVEYCNSIGYYPKVDRRMTAISRHIIFNLDTDENS